MKRKPDPELVDEENPEWQERDFKRAVRFAQLPESLQRKLGADEHEVVVVPDELVAVRVSAAVVERFRAAGSDWEQKIDDVLREWLARHASTDSPR